MHGIPDLYVWQVFQAFDCEDLAEIGKSYLRADLQIKCDTPSYQAYRVYAAVMIIICESVDSQ